MSSGDNNVVRLRPRLRPVVSSEMPERASAAPLVHPGMEFAKFCEVNADRIWHLLVIANRRDQTFHQLAREMWSSL